MHGVTRIEHLSGWLLPEGDWIAVEEWWHISALYDLRDTGYAPLATEASRIVLEAGEEAAIRHHVATLGLIKISRKMIDAYMMNGAQLRTLKGLLEVCDLEAELGLLTGHNGQVRNVSVSRLLKLRNPELLFMAQDSAQEK